MSSSHIPQPNAVGPTTDVTSTEAAPHGPSISDIGTGGPSPQEVPPHTGAINTLDITITRQFIPTDTVIWTVQQVKGSLLWFTPIHPSRSNPIVAYLNPLYNAWGGGFDFNFKIAGTGFHAGALAIVRIPPNRNPADFTSPASWGAFEWVMFDPKMLEVASIHAIDQRPINFHYQPLDYNQPNSFGGYLAMYVLIPLNTSATGSQQIQVQVFNRPAPDFQFSQLIYPYLDQPSGPILSPELRSIFEFNETTQFGSALPAPILNLVIAPSTLKTLNVGLYNSFGVGAKPMQKEFDFEINTFHSAESFGVGSLTIQENVDVFVSNSTFPCWPVKLTEATPPFYILTQTSIIDYGTPTKVVTGISDSSYVVSITPKKATEGSALVSQTFYTNDKAVDFVYEHTQLAPPAANESFVYFTFGGGLISTQTTMISEAFFRSKFDTIFPPNSAILFVLIDAKEKLPVGFVKLYAEGYFTAAATTAQVVYPIANFKLEFDSFILRTEPIPIKATYNTNRMLLSMKYRRDKKMLPSSKRQHQRTKN